MSRAAKNEYLRFLLKLLHEKYHVNISSLGRDVSFLEKDSDKYLRGFYSSSRNLGETNLDVLEDYLIELYGTLLDDELPFHKPYIDRLKNQEITLF